MAMFIDDGQQQTHEIQDGDERLTAVFRPMGTSEAEFLMMYLDNGSRHYNPAIAYEQAVPRVADCLVSLTHAKGSAAGVKLDPADALPRLKFAQFRELRNVVMGVTEAQRSKQAEREKN